MICDWLNHVNFVPRFLANGCEGFNVALAVAAQGKIITYPQAAQAQVIGQYLHEFSCAKASQL